MKCPYCGNDKSQVVDSRTKPDGNIYRRRRCECGIRYTTVERVYRSPDGKLVPPQKTLKLATGENGKWDFILMARKKVEG